MLTAVRWYESVLCDRYGFEYLVVPIMKLGGFRAFASRLREEDEEVEQAVRSGEGGGLALGR